MIRPAHIRHIREGASTDLGAVEITPGHYMAPQDRAGVNGRQGYQSGQENRKLREEADFTVVLPNDAGADGRLHRDRFKILADTGSYRIGDEWIEVYEGESPGGDLSVVGTPVSYTISRTTIELQCKDALATQTHSRETSGGLYWCASPRDVFDFYTRAWQAWLADDFPQDGRFSYSTADQSTADGRWTYRRAQNDTQGQSALLIGPVSSGLGTLTSVATVDLGDATMHHRLEATMTLAGFESNGDSVFFGFWDVGGLQLGLAVAGDGSVSIYGGGLYQGGASTLSDVNSNHALAIEARGRWGYLYVDGRLVAVEPIAAGDVYAQLQVSGPFGSHPAVSVDSIIARRTVPYLLRGADRGDYRLPGAPTPGGLLGSYFSEAVTSDYRAILSPLNKPFARRIDAAINFPAPGALPNAWQPAGAGSTGERFSVRWTGSIYLDDPSAFTFYVSYADRCRLWIGKTRWGEQILDDWPAGDQTIVRHAAAALGVGSEPGWYPIIIEYSEKYGPGGIVLETVRTGDGGTYRIPGADGPPLSPLGIFEDQVRGESHYEMLKQLSDTFGYQYLCEPQSLESGEFPGRVAPRVRAGRDYQVTVTDDTDTDLQAQVAADDCVDTLVADAQGIADQTGAAQLTAEGINFDELDQHLFVHSEAESLSDISVAQLLEQRLNSELALRSSPFEQVTAVTAGARQLVPVVGGAAEIAWQPGDGVYRDYQVFGVKDAGPTQITTVSRPFNPDGFGARSIGFRPRPRSFRDFLRRLQRRVAAPRRYYQGQLATKSGSPGSNIATAAPDAYSRVTLPANYDQDVARAVVVVRKKSDSSVWDLEVNGVVRTSVDDVDEYDVTAWVGPSAVGARQMQARLVSQGAGSTGTWEITLELLVTV